MGPPNVGKSVLFNSLTGMGVQVANYTGTTVDYTVGKLLHPPMTLIDVPGVYTLNANNDAEQVALEMLDRSPEGILCVLDALHLVTSLHLLLQILKRKIPTLVVINRCDLLKKKGWDLNPEVLAQELGVDVITTVAVTGEGKEAIVEGLKKLKTPLPIKDCSWEYAETLKEQLIMKKEPPQKEKRWDQLLIQPVPGLPLALLTLVLLFSLVIGMGMGLRRFLLLPLFRSMVVPVVELATSFLPPGMVQNILIGEYGILLKGIEWPFTLVMPYVISFYLGFSFLEDSGYLPRLAVLFEGLLHHMGLKGSSIIPLLLGYGCGIPGILATRSLGTRKERIMISSIICLAVPCVAQSGAFISLLAERSISLLLGVFLLAIMAQITAGLLLHPFMKKDHISTLMEIPQLLMPRGRILLKKVLYRLKQFLWDGALPMVGAVGVAGILYETGLMIYLGEAIKPLVTGWLKLPREAAVPLLLGIFRREMAVLPLLDMDLTNIQLLTGAVVGLFYVPCIAMIATLAREFKLPLAVSILFFTTTLAFFLGGLIARLGIFIAS